MRYLRKWDLPTLEEPVVEHLENIPDWSNHHFWYCCRCRSVYASAMLSGEDCSPKIWRALEGLCMTCAPDKWNIRGNLQGSIMIGWNVPQEVLSYLLDREIDFLCHPNHPHNKELPI